MLVLLPVFLSNKIYFLKIGLLVFFLIHFFKSQHPFASIRLLNI